MRPEHVAAAELLRSGVTVSHIMTSPLVRLDPNLEAGAAEEELASRGIDQAPLAEDPIHRHVLRDELRGVTGPVADAARPIEVQQVVAATTGLAHLLPAFRQTTHFYVLDRDGITGIVTRADLQLPPVSMAVLGIVTSLELALTELIDVYSHGSWLPLLPAARRAELEKRFDQRQRNNAEITRLECLDLVDRFEIVGRLQRLRRDLDLPRKRDASKLKKRILTLRNPLAHGGSVIGAHDDFDETLTIIDDVQNLGGLAWGLLSEGVFIWEVYAQTRIEPEAPERFADLLASGPTVHVLTAHNPHSRRPSDTANALANEQLRCLLVKKAKLMEAVSCRSAEGEWAEPSFAVTGLARETAIELARLFSQRAIFEIEGPTLRVIDCRTGDEQHTLPFQFPPV